MKTQVNFLLAFILSVLFMVQPASAAEPPKVSPLSPIKATVYTTAHVEETGRVSWLMTRVYSNTILNDAYFEDVWPMFSDNESSIINFRVVKNSGNLEVIPGDFNPFIVKGTVPSGKYVELTIGIEVLSNYTSGDPLNESITLYRGVDPQPWLEKVMMTVFLPENTSLKQSIRNNVITYTTSEGEFMLKPEKVENHLLKWEISEKTIEDNGVPIFLSTQIHAKRDLDTSLLVSWIALALAVGALIIGILLWWNLRTVMGRE